MMGKNLKNFLFVFSLLVLGLFVISACAPSGTFAGQAVKAKDLQKAAKALKSSSEICDNNIDDDKNGKMDCADPACAGFIFSKKQYQDVLCAKGETWVCGTSKSPLYSVVDVGGFDALCYQNGAYYSWVECDIDNNQERKGNNGLTLKKGAVISMSSSVSSVGFLCEKYLPNYESWIGCGAEATANVNAKTDDIYGNSVCLSGKFGSWYSNKPAAGKLCAVDKQCGPGLRCLNVKGGAGVCDVSEGDTPVLNKVKDDLKSIKNSGFFVSVQTLETRDPTQKCASSDAQLLSASGLKVLSSDCFLSDGRIEKSCVFDSVNTIQYICKNGCSAGQCTPN